MIGPFVQIVQQILEALLNARSAIGKSREKETKRVLLRLFFDLVDFENAVSRFIEHAKHGVSNRNHNSLRSAVMELQSLQPLLKKIIDRFYAVMRSDAGKYLLEVEGYRIGRTLDTAIGADMYLLHEWSYTLDSFVVEITQSTDKLPAHLDPNTVLEVLDERGFLFREQKEIRGILPRKKMLRLSELVVESELWLTSFKETVELYRTLVKSQVSLQDVL